MAAAIRGLASIRPSSPNMPQVWIVPDLHPAFVDHLEDLHFSGFDDVGAVGAIAFLEDRGSGGKVLRSGHEAFFLSSALLMTSSCDCSHLVLLRKEEKWQCW